MDLAAREAFNASFDQEKYQKLLAEIEQEYPQVLDFRIAESPFFISGDLKTQIMLAANQVLDQVMVMKELEKAIPEKYHFPNETSHPHCLALDFGICNEDGKLIPKLIELQGFPSLFGFQSYLSSKYKKFFDIPNTFSNFFNRLNNFSYQKEMGDFLKGKESKNTILLEIYPERQKTKLDFSLTKDFWGIESVCLSKIYLKGTQAFYEKDGEEHLVERVYNRLIFDEIDQKHPELAAQVELLKKADWQWVSHPNWFYKISKYALPFFKSRYVPVSYFLDKVDLEKIDLSEFVLKPLFSFAGTGVEISPDLEKINKISDKENYLLQQKVNYEPVIKDLKNDGVKVELRLLYIWPDGADRPKLVTNLARLSRGLMIGVDHNKNADWVGGSTAFFDIN